MPPHESQSALSVAKLRNLILVCLVLGVAAFTAVMFSIAYQLGNHFGPQVEADLRWRATRGARELARAAELGLAVRDADMITSAFAVYAAEDDVQAIVASAPDGRVLAQHGKAPETASALVRGAPGALRAERDYLVSWANAEIEGVAVGKIALVVSTRRHRDALALLKSAQLTVLVGGLLALVLGSLVVTYFTRAVAQRDAQLSDHAKNLERKVDERTRELDEQNRGLTRVLDNVAQGFITIDLAGVMASERSAVVDRWFGAPPAPTTRLSEYLAQRAPDFVCWLELGLAQLREDLLPAELTLAQLPRRFEDQGRTFEVSYTPIQHDQALTHLLVIISDVTTTLLRERAERAQRELMVLAQRIAADRNGVEEFLAQSAHLVAALRGERDPSVQRRLVHTLKGNCAVYGLDSYAELAHGIEDELTNDANGLGEAQRALLVQRWKETMRRVSDLLGNTRHDVVEIERRELEKLRVRLSATPQAADLLAIVSGFTQDPLAPRLARLAEQARVFAQRLNKPEPKIALEAHGIRLPPSTSFAAYWSALVHVVRNAVDHGIESAEERTALGKPAAGFLSLSATRAAGELTISVRDDGAGIRWERVRERAKAAGLPHQTQEDLVEALFADGLSTRDESSQVSGRGVGLPAVRDAVRELGGSITVNATPGKGTCFIFRFQEQNLARPAAKGRAAIASLLPDFS